MAAPTWFRTCLAQMAVRNYCSVITPIPLCVGCGSKLPFPQIRVTRSLDGGGLRQISALRHPIVGSVARKAFGQCETVSKKQRRRRVLKRSTVGGAAEGTLQLDTPEAENVHGESLLSDGAKLARADDKIAEELAAMTGTISISSQVPVALKSLCVGIDPDLSGAIAVLKTENDLTLAEVIDVPCVTVTVNKKLRRRHDYNSIANLVSQLQAPQGSIAYVEQAMPFPKDGKQGWYITGYGYGVWLGILAAAGFKVIPVQAKVWKAGMGICGKEFTKDDSRALASSIFPVLSPLLKRKKDHGRAEALLIAAFGKGITFGNIAVDEK